MTTLFCFASIQLRPNADHDMLAVGLCPGPSSQEDRTLAAWSKKKGPPLCEPSSFGGAPSSSTIPPLTVYAGSEQGAGKGKPSSQVNMGTGKGPSKSSKGDASPPAQDALF